MLRKNLMLYPDMFHRLCIRDPHQLFLRLESQVREFVIEMKVRLLKQLHPGCKTPQEAKAFISLLLDEYGHLCKVSRRLAETLTELVRMCLKNFFLKAKDQFKYLKLINN